MLIIKNSLSFLFLFVVLILSGCGGGGGGSGGSSGTFSLDGGPVSRSGGSASAPALYSFDVVAGTPYSIALVNTSGETTIYAYNYDPFSVATPSPFEISWTDGNYEAVSFIASSTGTVYVLAIAFDTSTTYTIEATTNHLTVGAVTRTDSVYGSGGMFSSDLFYSFEAQIGTTYEVRVTPTEGNVDITRVTLNSDMSGSVGSSLNTGTSIDSVFFTATATQRYYIRVDGTNVDSTFGIRVLEVPAGPDLIVEIDSAVSDGTNILINYTVYNNGADAYTGDFQVDVWGNSTTAPIVGSTGDNSITHTAVTIAGLGGTISGTATIANTGESGTAYAVVDTIEAVLESNESNNVSTGVSWQKPLLAPISFDFEDSIIPTKMVMSGDANWIIDNTTGGSGATSLRSENIGDSQISCFAISVYSSQSTSVSFDRRVSSESSWDELEFYIDNVKKNSWSGTVPWGNVSFTTGSGLHEYKWCYDKDFISSAGTDEAWVDNINIISTPTDLSVAVIGAVSDGTDVTVSYTVFNNSSIPAGAFTIDFWSDAISPSVGDTGEATVNIVSLSSYSSTSGSVTIANAALSGTAFAIVDTTNAVDENNEINNVSSGLSWTASIPDLSVAITSTVPDGTNLTVNYTVTNNGTGPSGAFDVDAWADTIPTVGDVGDNLTTHTGLAAGNSVDGTVVIVNGAASGTAYAIVDTSNAVRELDETDNVSAGDAWVTPPAGPFSFDFQSGSVPTELSMSGDVSWVLDTSNGAGTGGSKVSLRAGAGAITHSQKSCVAITVINSSSVAFDYNVSSEQGWDYLHFYIDNVLQDSWSGLVSWTNASYSVVTGVYEYKWCYSKDGTISNNADAAWIDNVTIN